jgi:hypothetical protein
MSFMDRKRLTKMREKSSHPGAAAQAQRQQVGRKIEVEQRFHRDSGSSQESSRSEMNS